MLALGGFERIAQICVAIADEVADDSGFVSVRRLLARFNARLVIRPMLVEGMLASIEDTNAASRARWVVLVDAETYRVSEHDVESEGLNRPLPTRLRNTIAHELLHSLAFRPSEFGISLKLKSGKRAAPEKLVRAIERETERLTPLLLWPEQALSKLLHGKPDALSVDELAETRRRVGVSRPVFITRLSMLHRLDRSGFLSSTALRNLAIGMAEWRDNERCVTRSWPLFMNFDRNLIPVFLRDVSAQDQAPAESIFADRQFVMCGGSDGQVDFVSPAGTQANPRAEEIRIEVSAERVSPSPGSTFLFVARIPATRANTDRLGDILGRASA